VDEVLKTNQQKLNDGANRKLEPDKDKAKKVTCILNILYKLTFLTPLPIELLCFCPIFLTFFANGKISQEFISKSDIPAEWDEECQSLGRKAFDLSFKLLKSICCSINVFGTLINTGSVSIIYRMSSYSLPDNVGITRKRRISENCCKMTFDTYCRKLMDALTGSLNETHGWREGFCMRTLLVSKNADELDRFALSIPLLYRNNDHAFRNFVAKGNILQRLFSLLTDFNDSSKLQDCMLALSSISSTLGLKSDMLCCGRKVCNTIVNCARRCPRIECPVKFVLDDELEVVADRKVLSSSPVFSAMFSGYFKETDEQKVNLRGTSIEALTLLLIQMENEVGGDQKVGIGEISVLFELMSLADQFLLEEIYEKATNTLINNICPYSASVTYAESVKWVHLWSSDRTGNRVDISKLILRYLLVNDKLSTNLRCSAFLKIFNCVDSSIIVSDLKELIKL